MSSNTKVEGPRLELESARAVQRIPMNAADEWLIIQDVDANQDRILTKGEYDRFVAQNAAQAVHLTVPVQSALDAAFTENPPPTVQIKTAADLREPRPKETIPAMLIYTAGAVVLTPFVVLLDVITLPVPKESDRSFFSATEGLWGGMARGWKEATSE